MNYFNRLEITILFSCLLIGFGLHGQEGQKMAFTAIKEGLSNNWISSIAQDDKGFIWVGTQDGLHRYDGYKFEVLRNSPEDPQSLAANWIRDIAMDANSNFWLATFGGGVSRFSPKTAAFTNFSKDAEHEFQGKLVTHIASAGKDHIISSWEEGFKLFDIHTDSFRDIGPGAFNAPLATYEDEIWLAGQNNELYTYNLRNESLRLVHTFNGQIKMLEYLPEVGLVVSLADTLVLFKNDGIEKEIKVKGTIKFSTHDSLGNHFMATDKSIIKFDPINFELDSVDTDIGLSELTVGALFLDRQGSLWVGTDKGLFKEKKSSEAFLPNTLKLHARRILSHKGALYVGGNDGLSHITENGIIGLVDDVRILGLASAGNTLMASTNNAKVLKFINDSLVSTILISTKRGKSLMVRGLATDLNRRLWVGCWEGLYVLDENDKQLKFISLNSQSKEGEAKITNLHIDSRDNLWITTTAFGIYRIANASKIDLGDVAARIIRYKNIEGDKTSLTSNIVMTMEEDNEAQMWFGSEIGVVKYETQTDNFTRLYCRGELFDKKIMTIRKDDIGNLWITTISNAIYVHNEKESTMRHFTEKDGLISNAFLFGSGFYDVAEKKLYFGTDEGVQQIDLSRSFSEKKNHTPIITDFQVATMEGDSIISAYQTPYLKELALKPHQNDFSIRFSALDFLNPDKIRYAYSLDSDEWKTTDLQTAYFTNMPFGSHTLKIQALYDGTFQNNDITSLHFYIKPPWYLSALSKFIYFLLLCATGLGIYLYLKWRWRMQLSLKMKEEEAERLQQLNDFKSNLYTDIAHEFKTPLTLISGPIDSCLTQGNLSEFNQSNFSIVQRNTHRLTSLVDQLLDLAKLEDGKLNMKISQGDLGLFLHTLAQSFEFGATQKKISFIKKIADLEGVWYDEDIIEKIITNLLSNALKYTPKRGVCTLSVKSKGDFAQIRVRNTAINAADLNLDQLFKRFYQHNAYSNGVGVGLSLVKELIRVYGGTIDASLEENDILCFIVELPITRSAFPQDAVKDHIKSLEEFKSGDEVMNLDFNSSEDPEEELPILLIVEDHAEIRAFIKLAFQKKYRILEAENGKKGLEIAQSEVPDIILSDVRMPLKNGIELCNAIKNDQRTSHIPIILLTASVGEKDELKGLTSGADDYITKPFKISLLQQRIANLVALRRKLRIRYRKELLLKPKDIAIIPSEEAFLNKIQQILEVNLSDQEFNAETFSKMANMSRMQLHRKLMTYTGLSTSAFIRSQRLKQAADLLKSSDLNISEVAYTVGFNTPRYFMKCFKETFKKTPSEYLQSADYQ